jgi:integrase
LTHAWAQRDRQRGKEPVAFNFTEARIEGLQPPAMGEETHADTSVPGLCVRVLASGAKSYFVRYRLGGRGSPQRRLTLGSAGAVRLDEARKAALKALAEVRHGGDPVAERNAKIEARVEVAEETTVAQLVERHEAEQLRRGVVTASATAKMLRRDLVDRVGAGRNPAKLTRADLVSVIHAVRDGVPGHAKARPGLYATFRARLYGLFETAAQDGLVPVNPLAGYRQPRWSRAQRLTEETRREGRMLTMEEIAALWTACADPRLSQSFGAYIRTLIVTACRRTELTLAQLAWVKPAAPDRFALLTIPKAVTKNGRELVLPLPPLAASVIAAVPRYVGVDLLFPGGRSRKTGKIATMSGWSKLWPSLLKVAREYGLTGPLRIHDLRKSARSHWERLGVADRVAEALLNHAEPDKLKSIYVLHDPLTEKSAALTLWCGEIGRALELRKAPSADVVVLPSGQKTIRRRAQSRRKSAK